MLEIDIAKGTTDPRVEFTTQFLTHILIKFHLQNFNQTSATVTTSSFELSSSLAKVTSIKSTKLYRVSQSVI